MDADVEKYLPQLRGALLARAGRLREALRRAPGGRDRRASRAPAVAAPPGAGDATATRADDDAALAELWECEAALRRLETGCYGTCCDCRGDVGLIELLLRPQAQRCEACENRHGPSA